jgi:hypothetical protein
MSSNPPIARSGVLTLLGFLAMSAGIVWISALGQVFNGNAAFFSLFPLAMGLVFALRIRWLSSLTLLVALGYMLTAINSPIVIYRISHPDEMSGFLATIVEYAGDALAFVAGAIWTAHNWRWRQGHTPVSVAATTHKSELN